MEHASVTGKSMVRARRLYFLLIFQKQTTVVFVCIGTRYYEEEQYNTYEGYKAPIPNQGEILDKWLSINSLCDNKI